jgi:glutamate synthase domain-containing protein 3
VTASDEDVAGTVVVIPEVREYSRINVEVVRRLSMGLDRVVLAGAEGQRLLLAGLSGPWLAVIEVRGRAGPELAAGLDAPGLRVACLGPAGDGAGRGLRAGTLLIRGDAGDAVGYTQAGGTIVVSGPAGPRAGLDQAGGALILLGPVGRLAGERQMGGRLFARDDRLGPHAGLGRRGGRLIRLSAEGALPDPVDPDDRLAFRAALDDLAPWLGPERP